MPLEPIFDFIDDMNPANPNNSPDQVKEAANHLRGVKNAVQGSFPTLGQQAVTLTAAQINQLPIDIGTNVTDIGTNATDITTLQNVQLTKKDRADFIRTGDRLDINNV